ncbi:hypothetical protein PIB30_040675 [Stylosanthes scabra]|uniref:TIR domain-containing protein n=1 Tax=Stylosanthes scabra TaxID=79078 RepID=A0ABU6QF73_9FABA|nr:hypothetical protein [Stylosanthes scabra]
MADNGEASSSSLSEGMYDVFLSFRGEDTRYIFTDHLYHRLTEIGKLKVFIDEPGLEMSDEIKATLMEAIKRSRMFIVVMSENYVSSSWCLMELEEMLKYSNDGKKRPIFPVFYYVLPAEVRYQISEKSKKAMADHEMRVGADKVKAWNSALSKVCDISGQHIVENKEYETKVMREIAEKVLAKHREIKLLLDRFGSQLEAVESLLNLESRETLKMVSIYEEDGKIDTTTFAFELYYKIKYEFKSASFLRDVSKQLWENTDNGLKNLEKELLSDMDVEESTKHRLQHRRVLVVLEGVDSKEHLDLLLEELRIGARFGGGSRIIITTEVKDLLDEIYFVDIRTHCIREDEFEGSRGMGEIVVGLEKDFDEVINQLKDKDSPGNVVSIVGMGGLGKTTLARKVYNSNKARQLFPCRAWATISQKPTLIQVLRDLLKCLKVPESEYEKLSDEGKLKEKVRKRLIGKKYLVVLDDVWDTDNPWGSLRSCFPTNKNNGSMILVTTRDDRVANALSSKNPHLTVSFMNEEESWQLFRNEVFYSEMCPPELEDIGRSIAKSCNGLPLVIKTTAGIVAKRERSEEAWEQIKKVLPYWSIAEDKDGKKMMERLKFSYDDLSEQMKPCFLYLGVFPEDEEILVRELICMWMAEDFIKAIIQSGRSKIEAEDIGEQYLKELVDRNLVQVVSRRSDGKGVKAVKIHDVIRELCISMSNNKAFSLSFPEEYIGGCYVCLVTRRDQSRTCSLIIYGNKHWWSLPIPEDCQVINVLYLEGLDGTLPDREYLMNKLKSIRFLKGDSYDLIDLLNNVQGLQTLYSELAGKVVIHEGLKQLRHIIFNYSEINFLADAGGVTHRMQNLQTLLRVRPDSQMWFLFNNGYFSNLRRLGLVISNGDEVELVETYLRSLDGLSKLRKLALNCGYNTWVSLGKIAFPSNLSSITLSRVFDFKYEDMNALGRIPGLGNLKLVGVSCSEDIFHCGSAGSFLQLQVFIMKGVIIDHVILEDGAMPKLQRAVFHHCTGLKFNCLPERMLSLGSNLHFVEEEEEEEEDD